MSLNKVCLLLLMLIFAATSSFGANSIACPSALQVQKKHFLLASADVYVGPPEQRANLIPDLDTSIWELSIEQNEARSRGDSLFLVCRFRGTAAVVSLKIPYELDRCGIKREKVTLRIECTALSPTSESKKS